LMGLPQVTAYAEHLAETLSSHLPGLTRRDLNPSALPVEAYPAL